MKKAQHILLRRWPVLLAAVLVALTTGWITRPTETTTSATWGANRLLTADLSQGGGEPSQLLQASKQVTAGASLSAAAEKLGREDRDALARQVEVTADTESRSLRISVTARSAEEAVEVAGAFADAFVEVSSAEQVASRQRRYDDAFAAVEALEARLARLEAAHPELLDPTQTPVADVQAEYLEVDQEYRDALAEVAVLEYDVATGAVFVAQPATPARQIREAATIVPQGGAMRWVVIAAAALLAGALAVWLLEKLSPRLDLDEEVVEALGLPLLGHIGAAPPRRPGPLSLDSDLAEGYRRLASVVRHLTTLPSRTGSAANSVIMFVSAEASEGKSTSTAMTAWCLAESGIPTLALGCDYRKPTLDAFLGVDRRPGIVERATPTIDRPELDEIVKAGPTPRLWVVPAGESTRLPVGCNDVARELISLARDDGVVVLVDSAPLLVVGDAVELFDVVDEIILVIRPGRTVTRHARAAVEMVRTNGSDVRGVVMVGSRQARSRRMRRYTKDYYRSRKEAPVVA